MAAPSSLRIVRRPKSSPQRALVAASQIVDDPSKAFKTPLGGVGGSAAQWQAEAWDMLTAVPELGYFSEWLSASCGRVKLIASELDDDGLPTGGVDPESAEAKRVTAIVRAIAGGRLGQTQYIKRSVVCLSTPGEYWTVILQLPDSPEGGSWFAVSADEVIKDSRGGVTIELPDKTKHEFVNGTDSMSRVWNPDPRKASEAHSPVKACLGSLREIRRTDRKIATIDDSRLIGNGVFIIPSEASLPYQQQAPVSADKPGDPPAAEPVRVPVGRQLQDMFVATASASLEAKRDGQGRNAAEVVPIVMTAPGEFIKNVQHIRFDDQMTKVELEKRENAVTRLARGLNVSPERLTGLASASNHWCVDDQTEILTQRGWLREYGLRIGDVALTLNHETGLSEWQPVLDVYRAGVVDELMISMESKSHSSLTTPGHRWPTIRPRYENHVKRESREFHVSAALNTRDCIPTAAPCADIPSEAKYTDAFVELVGWYWTEGAIVGKRGALIAQSHTVNHGRVARIRAALTALYGPAALDLSRLGRAGWRENIRANRDAFGGDITTFSLNVEAAAPLHEVAPDKILVPSFVRDLTRAQLELFIDVSAQGDGQHYRAGVLDMWQRDARALEAYELALILSGRMTQRQQIGGGHRVGVWKRTEIMPVAAASQSQRSASLSTILYTGTVWCPVTENSTWFARRNGKSFYTGNSMFAVGDEDVQLHISPVMETVCQAITANHLRTVLDREGIDPDKYVLWFDTSGLTADPDKTDEAQDAWEGGAIRASAYLELKGLPADAGYDFTKPDDVQQFALDAIARNPDLIVTYAPLIAQLRGIDFPQPPAIEQNPGTPPAQEETDPQQEPNTEGDNPDTGAAVREESQVQFAFDVLVSDRATRALELAGKRRRTHADGERLRHIPMHETHRAMGAVRREDIPGLIKGWDAGLDDLLVRYGLDAGRVRAAVLRLVQRELTAEVIDAEAG